MFLFFRRLETFSLIIGGGAAPQAEVPGPCKLGRIPEVHHSVSMYEGAHISLRKAGASFVSLTPNWVEQTVELVSRTRKED